MEEEEEVSSEEEEAFGFQAEEVVLPLLALAALFCKTIKATNLGKERLPSPFPLVLLAIIFLLLLKFANLVQQVHLVWQVKAEHARNVQLAATLRSQANQLALCVQAAATIHSQAKLVLLLASLALQEAIRALVFARQPLVCLV